ncbi:MAG TPA: hypothetical protein VFS43_09185 [Polyangiaceae bacterium]|nr:hypothetical protein [Polyangiaceae bacterium]
MASERRGGGGVRRHVGRGLALGLAAAALGGCSFLFDDGDLGDGGGGGGGGGGRAGGQGAGGRAGQAGAGLQGGGGATGASGGGGSTGGSGGAGGSGGQPFITPYVDLVLGDRPLLYFRFGEPDDADPVDLVSGAPLGRLFGSPSPTLGAPGAPIEEPSLGAFFGGGMMEVSGGPDLSFLAFGSFSFEGWFLPDVELAQGTRLFAQEGAFNLPQDGGVALLIDEGNVALRRVLQGGATITSFAVFGLRPGAYNYVAVSAGPQFINFCRGLDGDFLCSDDGIAEGVLADGPLLVGNGPTGVNAYKGALDEFALYDREVETAVFEKHFRAAAPALGAKHDRAPAPALGAKHDRAAASALGTKHVGAVAPAPRLRPAGGAPRSR